MKFRTGDFVSVGDLFGTGKDINYGQVVGVREGRMTIFFENGGRLCTPDNDPSVELVGPGPEIELGMSGPDIPYLIGRN